MKRVLRRNKRYGLRRLTAGCLAVLMMASGCLAGQDETVYAAVASAQGETAYAAASGEHVVYTAAAGTAGTRVKAAAASEKTPAAGEQTVSISSVEEFLEFAGQCQTETYSKGRRFVLEDNLDLNGTDFEAIPTFSGHFDGNGHRIFGFALTGPGSKCGLFRYLETGAVVENLDVEGSVVPGGDQEKAGGIAGVNEGTILNCTFRGIVTGENFVGGIAGTNEEGGIISGCTNYGQVSGHWKTGGVAGSSEGVLESCINEGAVNTDEELLDAEKDEDMSVNLDGLESGLSADIVSDAGGIAGYSSGTILSCVNKGDVGCLHMGSNIGGIAGRQDGFLEECKNEGIVIGSRNVAGIAGYFEPYLEEYYETDTLDELDSQMDVLKDMKDALSDQMRSMGDRAGDHMDVLDVLTEELKTMTRDYSDEREGKRDAFDEKAGSQMDIIEEIVDNMELDLESDSAKDACEEVSGELASMRRALSGLKDIKALGARDGDDGETGEEETDETGERILEELEAEYQDALDFIERMEQSGGRILNNIEIIWRDGVGNTIDSVQEFADDLDALRIEAQDLKDMVEDYKDTLSDDMKGFRNRIRDKTDEISEETDRLTDDLDADKDASQNIKDQMDDQMDRMSDTIDSGKEKARDRADDLEDEEGRFWDDVSGENTDASGKGLILSCENTGSITADYQAGGISGFIGYDRLSGSEQDPEAQGERSLNWNRTARALVRSCKNTGEVYAQNDYAGGIVGSAGIGTVMECRSFSDVKSDDGNYAGGIAGYSEGTLAGNYIKGTISGNDFVGGIAGYGKMVRDNCSMVVVKTSEADDEEESVPGEYHGSIVGDLDEDGELSGNLYVNNGLGANDGITHQNEAEMISYEEMLARDDIPEEFGRIQVSFLADGTLVGKADCAYGQAVETAKIPEIPEKSGFYGEWETEKLEHVLVDQMVHAVYRPFTSAIASSDEKKPLMMAEGAFYPGAELSAWEEEPAAVYAGTPENYRVSGAVGYRLNTGDAEAGAGNGAGAEGSGGTGEPVRLRVYAGAHAKHMRLGLADGDGLRLLETEINGEYLIFEAEPEGTIVLLEPAGIPKGTVYAAGAGILLTAAFGFGFLLIKRKKKSKKEKSKKQAEKDADRDRTPGDASSIDDGPDKSEKGGRMA